MPPENRRFGSFPSGRSSTDAFSDKNLFSNSFLLPLIMAMEEEKRRRRLLALQRALDPSSAAGDEVASLQLILGAGGRNPFSFLTGAPFQRERTTSSTLPGGTFTSVRGR